MPEQMREVFTQNVCVNSTAEILFDQEKKKEIRQGNQSECGLLKYILS